MTRDNRELSRLRMQPGAKSRFTGTNAPKLGIGAIAGIVLNWGWLVALGIAPLILAAVPCLAMCAFGLCADKLRDGQSCAPAKTDSTRDPGVSPERPKP